MENENSLSKSKSHTFFTVFVIPLLLLSFLFTFQNIHAQEQQLENVDEIIEQDEYLEGVIVEILEEKDIEFGEQTQKYQKLKIEITKGSLKGEEIVIENGDSPMSQVILYSKGDTVLISHSFSNDENDVFYITDFVRTKGIVILFILFILLSVTVATKKGFFSLISMMITFVILFSFVLPQIQSGKNPVVIAILASIVIIPITFYLSHGFEQKTSIAILGTSIALVITGILSNIFVNLTYLTGTSSEESLFLQTSGGLQYNLKGLLLAGIIIGTLGVIDDITISQTAIVYQLYSLKNDMSFSQLFKKSIEIGKDHIASMINTLILVYTGASLPLLLLFMSSTRPFGEILSYEVVTTEIVRTLVGSIGLILAVPITTYLACHFVKKTRNY